MHIQLTKDENDLLFQILYYEVQKVSEYSVKNLKLMLNIVKKLNGGKGESVPTETMHNTTVASVS